MALNFTEIAQYRLVCPPLGVTINCQLVTPLARLVKVMLCGWKLEKGSFEIADIKVSHDPIYQVTAVEIGFHAQHGDLISAFNELLICIAYLTCKKATGLRLLHGGAMIREGKFIAVLGGHKAGKSSYFARECHSNNILISDDLLLINKKRQLIGLGFCLRLRRPIAEDIIELYGAKHILAGHSLAYLGPKAISLYPAGLAFKPERLYLLENYQAQRKMRFKWRGLVEKRVIPITERVCSSQENLAPHIKFKLHEYNPF